MVGGGKCSKCGAHFASNEAFRKHWAQKHSRSAMKAKKRVYKAPKSSRRR